MIGRLAIAAPVYTGCVHQATGSIYATNFAYIQPRLQCTQRILCTLRRI
nr:MAG TPA_asm: hypothetical protein [Caudoviricetes sp.]